MTNSDHGDDQERIERISRAARKIHKRQTFWLIGGTVYFWSAWGIASYLFANWIGGDFFVGFLAGAIGWIGFATLLSDILSVFEHKLDRDVSDAFMQADRYREKEEAVRKKFRVDP